MENAIILFILFGLSLVFLVLYFLQKRKNKELLSQARTLQERVASLEKYDGILEIDNEIIRKQNEALAILRNAEKKSSEILNTAELLAKETSQKTQDSADKIIKAAQEELERAKEEKRLITMKANNIAESIKDRANTLYVSSQREANKIIEDAKKKAVDIAGEAYSVKEQADKYQRIADAMQNKIKGYGNEYIIPGRSLLDELAEDYSYSDAANDYKAVETQINNMIKDRTAGDCDYVEKYRKQTAIDFVVDAFTGKAASILSRTKIDNYGILKKELHDAFILVNNNGDAFRDARITEDFLRLYEEKLRLATVLLEIKEKDKEEQRAIREQMREEERARREIEKAIKDAAKQEDLLQKAMEKARAKYEAAGEEQKSKYEAQLAELEAKLKEVEERNQRAMSMAQQTKRGHIYIISNIGSFGEDIYKIGMTRRLEPLDRVRELGDASVPFPFDVHAMIWSEDAPALETELHKHFAINRVNKINLRKEFFNVHIKTIREEIESLGVKNIAWTMTAAAREYQETHALEKQMTENDTIRNTWLSNDKKAFHQLAYAEDTE